MTELSNRALFLALGVILTTVRPPMAQQQSIEAARARIQRLVDEITALAKSEVRSEEFYAQYLQRVVAACDGKGGAVWLVGQKNADGKNELQLASEVDLASSLFQSDEQQRGVLLRAVTEVVQTKKPLVLSAESRAGEKPDQQPGSLEAQLAQMGAGKPEQGKDSPSPNRTPYPFVHVPLLLKDQILGVLQVWLQPYVARDNYAEFATFLAQLAAHVETYFQSRQVGNLVMEGQRLQHLLKYSTDISGSLDPLEVCRLASNYARDLLGSERCAVLRLRGSGWEMMAISGQEVVERRSSMVKTITAFVDGHTPRIPMPMPVTEGQPPQFGPWVIALSKKELLALTEAGTVAPPERSIVIHPHGPTDAADVAYFENSQVGSALIVQILDGEKVVIGALLAESTTEGAFDPQAGSKAAPSSHKLGEWLATSTGKAMRGAMDYQELPGLFATRRLRELKRALTGTRRAWNTFKLIFWLALIGGVLLFPWMEEVESDCTLVPKKRVKIVPEVSGRVERVFVREGDVVKKGQELAKLDTRQLDAELENVRKQKLGSTLEAQAERGLGTEAKAQIAEKRAEGYGIVEAKLQADILAATLRSPMDGVVMTKDIELTQGLYLQAGGDFAVVGSTDAWDMLVHLNEKQIGRVEELQAEKKNVPVDFILYSHNTYELKAAFKDRRQLSQLAYPHERESAMKENAFILTLPDVEMPAEIRAALRPDLTGRASIKLGRNPLVMIWGRSIAKWVRLKWVW